MEYQETSRQAHESVKEHKPSIQQNILEMIKQNGTMTCYEVEVTLNLKHQTASASITHLKKKMLIEDSGERRKTESGRNAIAWKVRVPVTRDKDGQGRLF